MLKPYSYLMIVCLTFSLFGCIQLDDQGWHTIDAIGQPTPRHEAGLVAVAGKLYLLGGRRINPVNIFDTKDSSWSTGTVTPIELHHFQPVVFQEKIYIVGAMTGQWPNEVPVDRVIVYDPRSDQFEFSHSIPENRLRGASGAVVYQDKIYLVGGIVDGHNGKYQPWLDEYDPKTGNWRALADAPNARDHFQAAVIEDKLYAVAGRRSSHATQQDIELTVEQTNIFDFKSEQWQPVIAEQNIPTPRAGNMVIAWNGRLLVSGGESSKQQLAHNELELFDPVANQWESLAAMNSGRHGTGLAVIDDVLYVASGCAEQGGTPELTSIEKFNLVNLQSNTITPASQVSTEIYQQWHKVELDFIGPEVSEKDPDSPFLDYKLQVEFTHTVSGQKYSVPGFFAADGAAAETSANSGHIWRVRFAPDQVGQWEYNAVLFKGNEIAVNSLSQSPQQVKLTGARGSFLVVESDKHGKDFRAKGRLTAENGFFKFVKTENYWIKGGTNSPENFLGYIDFDGTYRIDAPARDGEAAPNKMLHAFAPHQNDWQLGDPVWQGSKGKGIIGGINYLASRGMNSVYFLTLNILGDGKDVWPYTSHREFTRFDVSKLAQWEIVFQHMQKQGILLHLVVQETENEKMLDDGETGTLRKLYFRELVARFAHHPALIWNLGEENGPAEWSPNAQNDLQRKAMAHYLKQTDPYQHPILLHTHSHEPVRGDILKPLLGFKPLAGLSLQADKRETVPQVIKHWKSKANTHAHNWLITMDEIGMWHTAAVPDSIDPQHLSLQRYALWGSLMAGAAGVEWYFGAKFPHNDLTSEDWRQRENLWRLTHHAIKFYDQHIPFWKMTPCDSKILSEEQGFCSQFKDNLLMLYIFSNTEVKVSIPNLKDQYEVSWFDPLVGSLFNESVSENRIIRKSFLVNRPANNRQQDWILLLRKIE